MATLLLSRIQEGDEQAVQELLPIVYEQLRAIAGGYFQGQPASHTLQPTALVHEAYLKLVGSGSGWKDRAHFCAVSATAMRQILANHARDKRADKRSGNRVQLTVDELPTPAGTSALDLLDLDDALSELSALNARHARMVELRFFGGLSTDEIANLLGISSGMVRREWRALRAWLSRRLDTGERG
ncbi:MAG: sigma-70 family RNA polymerase sigma factor [Myxococcales bacterium]|nr:MAG: sigma-70 family RNA polymerase sigma factor [Myxococcales bacterium]